MSRAANAASNAFDAVSYAIDQSLAPVISLSFGTCEPNVPSDGAAGVEDLAQQANAEPAGACHGEPATPLPYWLQPQERENDEVETAQPPSWNIGHINVAEGQRID